MVKLSFPHVKSGIMARAVQAFDKNSSIITGVIWGAAIILSILANISVGKAVHVREELVTAQATTPLTPQIAQTKLGDNDVQDVVDKLSKRYNQTLQIGLKTNEGIITIGAKDSSAFSTWLTAVTYVDILRPDIMWKIESLCVGPKCGDSLMSAALSAQKVTFSIPTPSE